MFQFKLGRCVPLCTTTFQRLIYTSATRPEADHSNLDPDNFGQLESQSGGREGGRERVGQKRNAKKKPQRKFPKFQYSEVGNFEDVGPYSQAGNFNTRRDNVEAYGVQPESTVEMWREFRDEEHRQTLRFLQGFQDDSEEDYNRQIQKIINGKKTINGRKNNTGDGREKGTRVMAREEEGQVMAKEAGRVMAEEAGRVMAGEEAGQVLAGENESTSGMQGHKFPSNFNSEIENGLHSPEFPNSSTGATRKLPNPDIFGTIAPQKVLYEAVEGDEGDRREEEFEEARQARRHRPQWYGQRMKNLCKERKLAEALQILEVEMPSVRARPNEFCYNVLINACGRAGYTKKAFKLYNQMKQRNLEIKGLVYTGLFMACSHSPWPTTDGLERATHLRQELIEKAYPINQTIAHVMIKAFGRCGDIKTAFQIVDEMSADGLVVTTETLNFLLQACITDTTTGFRHAIMVWRKMRELNLSPDIYSYNLLIRCTAECQAGDPTLTSQLLNPSHQSTSRHKNLGSSKKAITEKVLLLDINGKTDGVNDTVTTTQKRTDNEKRNTLDSDSSQNAEHKQNADQNYIDNQSTQNFSPPSPGHENNDNENILENEVNKSTSQSTKHKGSADQNDPKFLEERRFTEVEVQREVMEEGNSGLPSILGHKVTAGAVVALGPLDRPQDRLALLGGLAGLVEQMMRDKVKPDLKTVTQLLTSLPSDTHTEEALLQSMENIGLQPDTQFCNMVIRKRTMRGDLQAAKAILDVMQDHHLLPDLITFGCLALGCHNLHDAMELLDDMDRANFRPNLEIMGALAKNGIVTGNFYFVLEILREMRRRDLTPNAQMLTSLERGRVKAKKLILRQEGGGKVPKHKVDGARLFLLEYRTWLKGSKVQLPDHPWAQYKTEKETSAVGEAKS